MFKIDSSEAKKSFFMMALTPFTFQETKRMFYPLGSEKYREKFIQALLVRLLL